MRLFRAFKMWRTASISQSGVMRLGIDVLEGRTLLTALGGFGDVLCPTSPSGDPTILTDDWNFPGGPEIPYGPDCADGTFENAGGGGQTGPESDPSPPPDPSPSPTPDPSPSPTPGPEHPDWDWQKEFEGIEWDCNEPADEDEPVSVRSATDSNGRPSAADEDRQLHQIDVVRVPKAEKHLTGELVDWHRVKRNVDAIFSQLKVVANL